MTLYIVLLAALVLSSGVSAGVFMAFSDFIMRGLGGAAPDAGAAGMISVNRVVLRSVFLTGFFLMTPLAAGLAFWAPDVTPDRVRWFVGLGAGVYAVLVFGVTLVANVPLNKALEASGGEAAVWERYQRVWTAWNHVRSLGAILAFGLFGLAFALLI